MSGSRTDAAPESAAAPPGPRIPLDRIRRVVVRCPNWLGDTVMALPVLHALHRALPGAEVWCVGPWVPTLLEAEPGIDRRLPYGRGWRERWAVARELRRAAIDLVVILPNSFEAALHAWLAGARWRLGYAADGRARLLTHPVPVPAELTHQVASYLGILRPLGPVPPATPPALAVAPTRRAEARRLLAGLGLRAGTPAVAMQLGAAFGPSKLWGPDRLGALAARLEARGTPVVFLGGAGAGALLPPVAASMPIAARSLVGRDHPALLPALLAEFSVVVAADTGPAQVAAAVGVPVVALFGPTDPRLTAPLGPPHVALWHQPACAPCFQTRCPIDHRCMTAITVDEVATVVSDRLEARAAAGLRASP